MIQDVTFYTERSQYELNTADLGDGGALFLSWSMENKKKALFETSLNNFQSNSAKNKGGAIYYDLFSPRQLLKNTYQNNDAQYGKDYASYPYKLKLMSEIKNSLIPVSPSVGTKSITIEINPSMELRTEYFSGEQLSRNFIIGIYD
jgi:predicted outer membrane repeat protein